MKENKIIFTGPVGVGKTTAIAALSDDPPVKTDARASDMTLVRKGHTTVAMDYGVIRLDEDTKVHLYGTPGQERFNFMWEILSKGSMGLILLLDNTRADSLRKLSFLNIKRFNFFSRCIQRFIKNSTIGSRCDQDGRPVIARYRCLSKIFGPT